MTLQFLPLTRIIRKISEELTRKLGSGFSETTLINMRQFYTLNPIRPAPDELGWTDKVELLPIKDEKKRKRLEARILKEDLTFWTKATRSG